MVIDTEKDSFSLVVEYAVLLMLQLMVQLMVMALVSFFLKDLTKHYAMEIPSVPSYGQPQLITTGQKKLVIQLHHSVEKLMS